jgi:molybdopterin synthase catalytic subunit
MESKTVCSAEGLAALQFAIDELKARVPVWKKEVYEDEGAAWKSNKEYAERHKGAPEPSHTH